VRRISEAWNASCLPGSAAAKREVNRARRRMPAGLVIDHLTAALLSRGVASNAAYLTQNPPIVPFAFRVFAHIALAIAVCDSDGDELATVPVQPEGLLVGPLSMTPSMT
jgi:hypothetical protein